MVRVVDDTMLGTTSSNSVLAVGESPDFMHVRLSYGLTWREAQPKLEHGRGGITAISTCYYWKLKIQTFKFRALKNPVGGDLKLGFWVIMGSVGRS